MIAVDTNVVVRLLVQDDADQYARVRRLFETETVFIPKTVMLETEWVLRNLYRRAPDAIRAALIGLIGLPQVRAEDADTIVRALGCAAQGLDFADALHLASSRFADRFASFDRALAARAAAAGVDAEIVEP